LPRNESFAFILFIGGAKVNIIPKPAYLGFDKSARNGYTLPEPEP
jgi:hypothetical protein